MNPLDEFTAEADCACELVGRAIRNINDWAAIILLDARYQQPNKKAQLPAWLGQDIQSPSTFGALIKSLAAFMKRRKEATAVQA